MLYKIYILRSSIDYGPLAARRNRWNFIISNHDLKLYTLWESMFWNDDRDTLLYYRSRSNWKKKKKHKPSTTVEYWYECRYSTNSTLWKSTDKDSPIKFYNNSVFHRFYINSRARLMILYRTGLIKSPLPRINPRIIEEDCGFFFPIVKNKKEFKILIIINLQEISFLMFVRRRRW